MFENENERKLIGALRAVAGMTPEASPQVKNNLLAAFRQHSSARRRRQRIVWMGAAVGVVAILVCGGVLITMRPLSLKKESNAAQLSVPSPSVNSTQVIASTQQAVGPRLASQSRKRKHSTTAQPKERVTEFVSLPFSDSSLPLDNVVIIRVTLPGTALALAGLPVAEERSGGVVQADLVLGEDGLARAVRFVM